jgi:DNA polymerase theta
LRAHVTGFLFADKLRRQDGAVRGSRFRIVAISFTRKLAMEPDCDDELCYLEPAQVLSPVATGAHGLKLLTSAHSEENSLGTWIFDKRHRQRKYVSLTGKVYTGAEAMRVARTDQNSEKNPTKSARYELKYLISSSNAAIVAQANVAASAESPFVQLATWGIPAVVLSRYTRNKVTTLFPWQIQCLTVNDGAVLLGKQHLIYSAPTSGGKTLVSEILMLRRLAQFMPSHTDVPSTDGTASSKTVSRRHTIFFVVPFVALAEEKAAYFQDIWQDMNIGVKAFHGDGGDGTGNVLSEDVEVAVCTIERANILLTQLLDEGREDQLKMVVIDEIHMLADAQRGFLLEVMLSKIKYLLNDAVQVVGMSATLPNIADLAGWLGAALYTTQYRPVDLEVKVCVNHNLYTAARGTAGEPPAKASTDSSPDASIVPANATAQLQTVDPPVTSEAPSAAAIEVTAMSTSATAAGGDAAVSAVETIPAVYSFESAVGLLPDDPDGMRRLCLDTVATGKSVMLFCNSKRRCEVCASAVAESITQHMHLISGTSTRVAPTIRTGRLACIESLSQTQVGLCPILRLTLPHGVAYHHAGLTLDERKVVEEGFRQGFIQVLCTTSTLSAGVNMPAHRVIIR